MRPWSLVNAIYQIYPRSFMDTMSDGIGDLRGIIDKLDYLKGGQKSLGADAIWLSPFYPSPMADFGYDVSDYCNVHPMFGTLDDFRELLQAAHARSINVMIDFVPNHTSHEHQWFVESRFSKESPRRDYYIWKDPKPDGSPPNNWLSIFGGSAWEFDETSGQYYLHSFLKEQPDLNWGNPEVRHEMANVLRFWFDMGVDGVRADAVRWIAKDPDFRDDLINPAYVEGGDPYGKLLHANSKYGRDLFRYLKELTDVVSQYPNRIMIFEDYPDMIYSTRDQYLGFYNVNPKVSMPFNFEGMWAPWGAQSFGKFVSEFQSMLLPEHVPVYCFGNHDQKRLASRFGKEQARVVAVLQLTLPGLPVIYYGDEIGMEDGIILPESVHDPVELKTPGIGLGRDPERTPMQWSAEKHAGFTTGSPWLPIHANFTATNVTTEFDDEDSILSLYRGLLALRDEYPVFASGHYKELAEGNPDVLVYERSDATTKFFVALNFSDVMSRVILPYGGEVIISSHPVRKPAITLFGEMSLRPFEAVVVRAQVSGGIMSGRSSQSLDDQLQHTGIFRG